MHEALGHDAASVARQLLDFLREPARHRPRYTRYRAAPPAGHHLLRFAQGRFPHALMRDLAKPERERLRQGACDFIRQVCFRDDATHYDVLCVSPDAKRDAIKENYHLLMALIHPDRQETLAAPWPTDFAQRVNRAYAVLADDASRRQYDAGLRHRDARPASAADAAARAGIAAARRPRARRERAGLRIARILIALTAVVATLLLLEVWVHEGSGEQSLLQGALAGLRSRDAIASAERPRFMGANPAPAAAGANDLTPPAKESPGFELLAPWWRAIEGTPAPARATPPPASEPTVASAARVEIAPPALERSEAPSLVQASAAPQAPPAAIAPSNEAGLTSRDVENMVVRVVGYYEAGEADKLMALLDPNAHGFWKAARMRQAYSDFFTATKQRRLRVDNLAWQTEPGAAHARGAATVVAEYFDAPGTQERHTDIEMDIALRDGRPTITRLTLFPNSP
jgi:hypothetical protein